jgi:hypothetical protein
VACCKGDMLKSLRGSVRIVKNLGCRKYELNLCTNCTHVVKLNGLGESQKYAGALVQGISKNYVDRKLISIGTFKNT